VKSSADFLNGFLAVLILSPQLEPVGFNKRENPRVTVSAIYSLLPTIPGYYAMIFIHSVQEFVCSGRG
jgi:hypothetical protein